MKILIVEDDKHKSSDIINFISTIGVDKYSVHLTESIADTIKYLSTTTPDRIILDMSLPSHTTKLGDGSAIPLPNGGIEIVLELRYNGFTELPILILTQYPQIEINNNLHPLEDASDIIMSTFSMNNIAVCEFATEDSSEAPSSWEVHLREFLGEA